MKKFKEGQWLVKKWKKECGGETDFVRFDKEVDADNFMYTKFYRIRDKVSDNLFGEYENENKPIPYIDDRMSLQFRPATKAEIQKYSLIIINTP